jgi:hypothetical protein
MGVDVAICSNVMCASVAVFHRVDRSGPRLRAGDAMFVFADAPSTSRSPVSRGLQGLGEAGGSEVCSDRILQQLDNLR